MTNTELLARNSFLYCSEEKMEYALGVVPPIYIGNGFLMGEPYTHHYCAVTGDLLPAYHGYFRDYGMPCVTKCPHTRHEFKRLLEELDPFNNQPK